MSRKAQGSRSHGIRRILSIETLEDRCMLSCSGSNADFDSSGTVDGADLTVWQSGFASGTAHAQGDADNDSDVDGGDFLEWQRGFGQQTSSSACIDISIDGLGETAEENPGAIVFRNSAFSKQSLTAVQPESGKDKYVPDYLAPSAIFDTNSLSDFTRAVVNIDPGMVGNYQVQFTFDDVKLELWTSSNWNGLVRLSQLARA